MRTVCIALLITTAGILLSQPVVSYGNQNQSLLDQIGVTRGICVVLGDAGCERALQLAQKSELLIYLQLPRAEDVQAAREIADEVYDSTVFDKVFLISSNGRDVVWVSNQNNKKVLCFDQLDKKLLKAKMANPGNRFNINWSRLGVKDKPLWDYDCRDSVAMAVCKNAVVVACKSEIVALDLQNGKILWSKAVPAAPVLWGLAIDRDGRAIVSLEDGQVLCLGSSS